MKIFQWLGLKHLKSNPHVPIRYHPESNRKVMLVGALRKGDFNKKPSVNREAP